MSIPFFWLYTVKQYLNNIWSLPYTGTIEIFWSIIVSVFIEYIYIDAASLKQHCADSYYTGIFKYITIDNEVILTKAILNAWKIAGSWLQVSFWKR